MLSIGTIHASNPLSRVYIHHVSSTKGGTEFIPQEGSWTAEDHGGARRPSKHVGRQWPRGRHYEVVVLPNGSGGAKRATLQIR